MTPDSFDTTLDKRSVRDRFHRSAGSYDRVAVLQRTVADQLLDRLQWLKIAPRRILDVGCGTGYCTRALAQRYPQAQIIGLDLAPGMVRQAREQLGWIERLKGRQKYLCGDAENLPFADGSVDLIVSNLAVQWCDPFDAAAAEFQRVLAPGGLLLFSTFGPDTLKELRTAWSRVDGHVHVNTFLDMHDLGDALVRNRIGGPVLDVDRYTLTYSSVRALMQDLKSLGSTNSHRDRPRGLTGKAQLAAMEHQYESFRREGQLPASYEVIFAHGWAGEAPTIQPGEFGIRLDQIGGRQRRD